MQICENTEGSYNCKCEADFKVDPSNLNNCIGTFFQNYVTDCTDRKLFLTILKTVHSHQFSGIFLLLLNARIETQGNWTKAQPLVLRGLFPFLSFFFFFFISRALKSNQ